MVKYPDDWKVVRLGEVCSKIGSGATPTGGASSYCDVGVSLIRSQNVLDNCFSETGLAHINDEQAALLDNVAVQSCDILLNITGDSVARVCVVNEAVLPARVNQHVCILRTKSCDCDYNYVCYKLVHDKDRLLTIAVAGATRNALTKRNVEEFALTLPPLPEQKRIAAVLGKVDKLIDNLSRQIEKKRLVKQGVMQDLLTGKKRLPGFKGEWEEIAFRDCFELRRNNTCARSMMTRIGGEIRNIHYGDILVQYDDVVNCKKRTLPYLSEEGEKCAAKEYLRDGDIVIADTAEDDAAGKVVEIRGVGNQKVVSGLHTVFCRPKFAFAEGWLGHWMNSPMYHGQLLSLMTGIKVLSLSRASFLKTRIAVPTLAEQKAIAKVLVDMDAEIAKLEAKHEKYRQLKQGLMNDLLTGKVRF